ncbi:MAG: hypothetical protein LUG16_02785 [Candidatus Gastranaerophilales bacterium]|nr:hypothetical protein [Candidatus Gastranaerophilales bacterium]
MKEIKIALVDGNNFFAGCEIWRNPSLKGKPLCILSNNDGCVIARSNEAKKLGITMGMPYFLAKKNFKNVIYLSSDFTLYQELSSRMMQYLMNYSDKVDVYSIDEAFLDVTGLNNLMNLSYPQIACKIRDDIKEAIGISVSVGISSTKMLAKLAAHKAKSRKFAYYIGNNMINEELQNIPVEEIWGVGRNIARSLRKFGIFYADEILLKDDEFYRYNYGKKGLELKYELSGRSVIPISAIPDKPKSIQRTRAFPEFSSDKEYIKTELLLHLHNVCKKLREHNLSTDVISVMLRTKDFRVYFKDKKINFSVNSEMLLSDYVNELFENIFIDGVIYRAAGVCAFSLKNIEKEQLTFFRDEKNARCEKLSAIVDKIETKYGKGVIAAGSRGIKSVMEKHKRIMRFRCGEEKTFDCP